MSDELDNIIALAADFNPSTVSLSPDTLAVLLYASVPFQQKRFWINRSNPADEITDEQWDIIEEMVAEAFKELFTPMIGVIIELAAAEFPPNILPCDGATYNRVDYPDLYAVIDPVFQVDADTFVVPDLRERFVVGVGTTVVIGDTGGAVNTTLVVGNLPAHSHDATVTDAGHAHSEVAAVPTVINGGLEAPAVAAEATPASTGLAFTGISVAIGDTGSGDPVDILPPFMALRKGIVAF